VPEHTNSPESAVANPKLISFARKRRGLTKTELAKQVGLDLRTISAYESGEKKATRGALIRIQNALDFPMEFFFGDDIELPPADGVSFRALSRMTAKQRDMAESQGALAMKFAVWLDKKFELPPSKIPDLKEFVKTPETAADAIRRIWGLGELPIRNTVHLLEANGARVFSLSIEAKEVDAFSWWWGDTPFVMLNNFKSAEHSRFDAAHELAHLVLHRHIGGGRSREAEFQADAFASALLMPEGSVRGYAPKFPTLDALLKLKHTWGVSVSALNYRLHKLGIISDWHYRSLCIAIGRSGFRTLEPQEQPRESSAVLPRLLKSLYEDDGLGRSAIARELAISQTEVDHLLFGLAITAIEGSRSGVVPKSLAKLFVVK
jgi:Zn-dependent peptidase ImmA (M78 family)/transcriptional regulator with XRE-family HTH domain